MSVFTMASIVMRLPQFWRIKERDGPSRALIDRLATSHVQLTIADFVSVVRNVAKRGDVAKLLEEYDSQRE